MDWFAPRYLVAGVVARYPGWACSGWWYHGGGGVMVQVVVVVMGNGGGNG